MLNEVGQESVGWYCEEKLSWTLRDGGGGFSVLAMISLMSVLPWRLGYGY